MDNVFSIKELYDLVWSKPLTTLAKEFAYSDNGLRKLCKRHNIPLPKLGHWQKIQYGKKVKVELLPKNFDKNVKITLQRRKEGGTKDNNFISDFHKKRKEIENDSSLNFEVPDKLSKPDPLIAQLKEHLKQKKPSHISGKDGLLVSSMNYLNVEIAKANIKRTLCFMDAFIKLIKKRGHLIEIDGSTTKLIINEESLNIRLREALKRVKVKDGNWERNEFVPSGFLTLRLDETYPEKQWKDSDNKPLEIQLASILSSLELKANRNKELRLQREFQHKLWEKQLEKKKELKLLRENELSNFLKLFDVASRWHKSRYIRDYINEFKHFSIKNKLLDDDKKKWIEWAKDKADWYDPFIEKEDKLLDNINRDTLEVK